MKRLELLAGLLFLGPMGYAQVIGTVVNAQGTWCDTSHQECHSHDFQGLWKITAVQISRLTTGGFRGRRRG